MSWGTRRSAAPCSPPRSPTRRVNARRPVSERPGERRPVRAADRRGERGRAPVVVIGAGLAGLTAAAYLRRLGIRVRVFEAGPHIAGLAKTERDPEGFVYDFGAHFITNSLAAAIGVGAHCRTVKHYGETVRLEDAPTRIRWGSC